MDYQSLEQMEKRIENIEYRVKLLSEIADFDNHPFIFTVLEVNLTEAQVTGIYDVMDQAREIIRSGKQSSLLKIEQGFYEIVPEKKGDYHFVEEIIGALKDERRWVEVYNHLKKKGFDS